MLSKDGSYKGLGWLIYQQLTSHKELDIQIMAACSKVKEIGCAESGAMLSSYKERPSWWDSCSSQRIRINSQKLPNEVAAPQLVQLYPA